MFAQLGSLRFERTTYFTGLESTRRFDFAEHPVIQGKPRLQAMGAGLESLVLDMRFQSTWCDPKTTEQRLNEMATRREAVPLTFGDGTYRGRFVIIEIVATVQHCGPNGAVEWLDARVQLKEWVDDKPLVTARKQQQAKAPAVKKAGGKPHAQAKKTKDGKPPFTVQAQTNKDGFTANKIVRQS